MNARPEGEYLFDNASSVQAFYALIEAMYVGARAAGFPESTLARIVDHISDIENLAARR